MKKSLILMACVSVVAVALVACHRENGFSAGTEMNADEIKAYREKLLAESAVDSGSNGNTTPEITEKSGSEEQKLQENEKNNDPETEESQELPDICYYVENGSVWHASKGCSYLKKAKEILEGDLEQAQASGKSDPCSRCASNWK